MPDPGIKLTRFGGLAPRMATELLPETFAQVAVNCKITSGDIVPYFESLFLLDTLIEDPLTIHPIILDDIFYWMMWSEDVDVVRSPVPTVTEQQFYYTGAADETGGGFKPKATDVNRATFYRLAGDPKITSYTVTTDDYEKTVRFEVGAVSCYLPPVTTAGNQFVFVLENTSGSEVTIDPSGSELVNDAATFAVPSGTKYRVKCDGGDWTATQVSVYPYDYFDLGVPAPTGVCAIAFNVVEFNAPYLGSGDLNIIGRTPSITIGP